MILRALARLVLLPYGLARAIVLMGSIVALGGTPALGQTSPSPLPKYLHEVNESGLEQYIAWLQGTKATPSERLFDAALRSLHQPYKLGAAVFSNRETDCVSFVEHILAISLANSRESCYRLIARLRYAGGQFPPAGTSLQSHPVLPL